MKKLFRIRTIITIAVIGIVAFLIFSKISGRSGTEDQEVIEKVQQVRVINTSDFLAPESQISAAGEVKASEQNEIRAEIGAKIERIFVNVGEEVSAGQAIAKLDTSTVDIQLAQASATIERIKAQRNQQASGARTETKQSAQSALDRARIALLQSQQQLEQVKINNEDSIRRSKANIEKLESRIAENRKLTDEAIKGANDNLETAVKNAMNSIDSSLLTMGNMLGEDPGDELSNDSYENVFGAKSQSQVEDFKQDFIDFRERFEIFRNEFNSIKYSATPQQLIDFSEKIENQLRKVSDLLEKNRITLDNTITQGGFNDIALNGLKAQVRAAISASNGQFSALSAARQRIADTKVKSETTEDSLNIDIQKAKDDLESTRIQNVKTEQIAEKGVQIQETAVKQAELSVQELQSGPRGIDLAGLDASIKEAQAAYSLISKNKEKGTIKANFSGTIADIPFKEGEIVNPGQVVASLVNTSGIEVSAYISSIDRNLINNNSRVLINGTIEGKIESISPRIDPQKKKIEAIISIDQNSNLKIGEFVEVTFASENESAAGKIFLPFKAIKNTPEGAYVLRVSTEQGASEVELQQISLGQIIGDKIEVTGGLLPDMEIIESSRGLTKGDKVEVANENTQESTEASEDKISDGKVKVVL